jgi:NAD(P)-dependent dehydrogenase (short-subunit alcohol dehydrogenase family)
MPRTILVTESDSPLGAALVRLLAARGYRVAAVSDRGPSAAAASVGAATAGVASVGTPSNPLALAWNRRSPVSARNIVLSVLNAFETLDEALILEPPGPGGVPLTETASADIERAFDDSKGPVFLAREVLGSFLARGGGVVSFVSGGPAAGPVESAAREAFRGLAGSLLASPPNGAIVTNGFQCGATDPEEYAAFIDRTLEEKARKITGRWFSYPPRGGFLQGVLSGR